MISPVDPFLDAFAEAGADIITVHPEAGPHLHRTVQRIKALGKKAGVSLNPATPAKALDYVLEEVDLVLVMSVNPGFGGQKFIASQLAQDRGDRQAHRQATGSTIELEVDGGIDPETARAGGRRRRDRARRRHRGIPRRPRGLRRQHQGAQGRADERRRLGRRARGRQQARARLAAVAAQAVAGSR